MKQILTRGELKVAQGVKVDVKSREVTVKGPLGTLKRSFKHVSADIYKKKSKEGVSSVIVESKYLIKVWFGARKQKCSVTSVVSHIKNMIRGVTAGFKYRMRQANSHFPINTHVLGDKKTLEIKNFIGEKIVRKIVARDGVTIEKDEKEVGQLWVQGCSLENVSQTCALIHQSCAVKNKDIRCFLDGIYVSDKRLPIKE